MRRRRGIALLAALALMSFVSLLVVGALAASTLAQRGSRLAHTDAMLNTAADFAVNTVLADPMGYDLARLPFGYVQIFPIVLPGASGVVVNVSATRLRDGVLWIVATAARGGLDQGQRRINMVARFPAMRLPPAAVVSRGGVSIGQNVILSIDTAPDADCSAIPNVDIIVAPGTTTAGTDTLRVATLPLAADSATYHLAYGELAALDSAANVQHVRGDTVIAGGSFDGIMIVDGALTIAGPLAVRGLIVARGPIDARAGGFSVVGSVMSFAAPSAAMNAIQLASATVQYSACEVARVLRIARPPRPARRRSWAELI